MDCSRFLFSRFLFQPSLIMFLLLIGEVFMLAPSFSQLFVRFYCGFIGSYLCLGFGVASGFGFHRSRDMDKSVGELGVVSRNGT